MHVRLQSSYFRLDLFTRLNSGKTSWLNNMNDFCSQRRSSLTYQPPSLEMNREEAEEEEREEKVFYYEHDECSAPSRTTLWWMNPVLSYGYKHPLELKNFASLPRVSTWLPKTTNSEIEALRYDLVIKIYYCFHWKTALRLSVYSGIILKHMQVMLVILLYLL